MSETNNHVYTLLRDIRDTQLTQAESLGKMAANIDALAGENGRVTRMEKQQTRQWWVSAAIAPALAIAHAVLRKMGVIV